MYFMYFFKYDAPIQYYYGISIFETIGAHVARIPEFQQALAPLSFFSCKLEWKVTVGLDHWLRLFLIEADADCRTPAHPQQARPDRRPTV